MSGNRIGDSRKKGEKMLFLKHIRYTDILREVSFR